MSCQCAPPSPAQSHPFHLLLRNPGDPWTFGSRKRLLYHHCKVWDLARRRLKASSINTHTPLWHNPCLAELLSVPYHDLWIARRVVYIVV